MENKKPDWGKILGNKGDEIYYFAMADVPASMKNEDIISELKVMI